MRRLTLALLSSAAFGMAASAAVAADLPIRAHSFAAPAFSWTGFYIGLNAGYATGRSSPSQAISGLNPATAVTPFLISDIAGMAVSSDVNTITGGFQAGYNLQFANNLVVGLEADINSFRLNSSVAIPNHFVTSFNKNTAQTGTATSDLLATVRGRLGYADDRLLAYVTGGAAFTDYKNTRVLTVVSTSQPQTDTFTTSSDNRLGWAAGAGFEYAWTNRWSIKGEYLHLDFGTKSRVATRASVTGGAVDVGMLKSSVTVTEKLTAELMRVGINYKFGTQ